MCISNKIKPQKHLDNVPCEIIFLCWHSRFSMNFANKSRKRSSLSQMSDFFTWSSLPPSVLPSVAQSLSSLAPFCSRVQSVFFLQQPSPSPSPARLGISPVWQSPCPARLSPSAATAAQSPWSLSPCPSSVFRYQSPSFVHHLVSQRGKIVNIIHNTTK